VVDVVADFDFFLRSGGGGEGAVNQADHHAQDGDGDHHFEKGETGVTM